MPRTASKPSAEQAPLDLRSHFARFRRNHDANGLLHFAAHSHHFWPDASEDAQAACWHDSAEFADRKWNHVLGTVWGDVRAGIARHLNLPDPSTLVPAPNTHELVLRLLSCLPQDRPARILTTDGEFHSFRRQCARLEEDGLVELTTVPTEPFVDFTERFLDAAQAGAGFDMVFFSQVFFNSGYANDNLNGLVGGLGHLPDALVVIDGYHGYLARPTDLSEIADRVFYLAGGYKYAMAGEGACFMHCPPGVAPRPRNTGWYAGIADLARAQSGVPFAEDGWRFMGATFDPSGLYRMRASLEWLGRMGLDAAAIHVHARALQRQFVSGLDKKVFGPFDGKALVVAIDDPAAGNFLTFRNPEAEHWQGALRDRGVIVDSRGDRLRVGFGLYQTAEDVDTLLQRIKQLD